MTECWKRRHKRHTRSEDKIVLGFDHDKMDLWEIRDTQPCLTRWLRNDQEKNIRDTKKTHQSGKHTLQTRFSQHQNFLPQRLFHLARSALSGLCVEKTSVHKAMRTACTVNNKDLTLRTDFSLGVTPLNRRLYDPNPTKGGEPTLLIFILFLSTIWVQRKLCELAAALASGAILPLVAPIA
jgi:hypothetical protein